MADQISLHLPQEKRSVFRTKTFRLLAMLSLTFAFFVVELVIGNITHSVALVADAFHMLSDVLALVVAIVAVRLAPRQSDVNTFGWARAEIIGANVNTVFLLALCLTIVFDAIERFINPEPIENPTLLLIVGAIGLGINLIGLFLFQGFHGHSHHQTPSEKVAAHNDGSFGMMVEVETGPKVKQASMNMHGVFLHVLADALGSVVVIISALLIKFVPHDHADRTHWTVYVDPTLSIVIVVIIALSAVPLLRDTTAILLQCIPKHLKIGEITSELLTSIPEISGIHELHVWRLTDDKLIASAHLSRKDLSNYMAVAEKVTKFFHSIGVHSVTIQYECDDATESNANGRSRTSATIPGDCLLRCTEEKCDKERCCTTSTTHSLSTKDAAF